MKERLERMRNGKGFIAALDQSGGSTPKALKVYGIDESEYSNDTEMFDLIHKMRTRIIKSPAFSDKEIVGAILFEQTMDRKIDDKYTADFLWEEKGVLPFLLPIFITLVIITLFPQIILFLPNLIVGG